MKSAIIALPGFLGRGSDWDAVRNASKADVDWICMDPFELGAFSFEPPQSDSPCWLVGYSFGARLALSWLQKDPARWRGALLLSANPGNFQTDGEREARLRADRAWARDFRNEAWDVLVAKWNAQDVFGGSVCALRAEKDFDRTKLADALEKFSVGDQFTDVSRLSGDFVWMAGKDDAKFCALLDDMRNAGFPGSFLRIEGAGHRLLHDAPEAVAAAMDDLVA